MKIVLKFMCIFISLLLTFNLGLLTHDEHYNTSTIYSKSKVSTEKNKGKIYLDKVKKNTKTTEIGEKSESSFREITDLNIQNKTFKSIVIIDIFKLQELFYSFKNSTLKLGPIINPNISFICFEKDINPPILI